MTLQTGKIYKVKEGHEWKCGEFSKSKGVYIKIKSLNHPNHGGLFYDILDKNKDYIIWCLGCFTEDDLELEEEVKEKSLEDLEVEPIVKLIYLYESDSIKNQTMRKEINLLYTLLEEKLGIKVKIK